MSNMSDISFAMGTFSYQNYKSGGQIGDLKLVFLDHFQSIFRNFPDILNMILVNTSFKSYDFACCNSRGGYRISEGGGVQVTVNYQNVLHWRFVPLYGVWESPKGAGGPDPQDPPPPWILP